MNNNLTDLENAIYNSIPRLRELQNYDKIKNNISEAMKHYVFADDKYAKGNIHAYRHCSEILKEAEKEPLPILINDVLEWLASLSNSKSNTISEISFRHLNILNEWNLSKPALKDQTYKLSLMRSSVFQPIYLFHTLQF